MGYMDFGGMRGLTRDFAEVLWGKKMRGWEGAEPTSQNRDVGHPALARQTPLRMTNRRGTDRDSEPSAQNDEQKQMRGFFATLRMTVFTTQPQVLRLDVSRLAQDDDEEEESHSSR
jgi:hypothetical protein